MNLIWLAWPFIVLLSLSSRALWRVLHRWYLPVGAGLVAYPTMFVTIVINYARPRPLTRETELWQFQQLIRWWHWWRLFGVARLLSDRWTTFQPPYPTGKQELDGLLSVPLAASLTVASLVFATLFVWALVASFNQSIQPFGSRVKA